MGNSNCCEKTNQNDKDFDVEKIYTSKKKDSKNNNTERIQKIENCENFNYS